MNVFFLALAVCAAGIPHALSQDSPQVAAAKAAHFEAVRRAELVIAKGPPAKNRADVPETTQHQLGVNVQDTPEVAAAKAVHFEAVRDAEHATAVANATSRHQTGGHADIHTSSGSHGHHHAAPAHGHGASHVHHTSPAYYPSHAHYRPDYGYYSSPPHHHHYVPDVHYHPAYPYTSAVVQTTQHKLGVNVQDTPEVAAAKVVHFNAVRQAEQAALASDHNDDGSYLRYNNAPLVPVVISSALPDTPEVAAAKAAHFEAVRRAQAAAGPQITHYVQEVVYMPVAYHPKVVVTAPQTTQHKLGVNVHDTPEVAAAKAAHFAAFRQAQLAAAADEDVKSAPHNNFYANTARQYGQVTY